MLRRGVDPPSTDQYAVVSATGTYQASQTVLVRYQTHNGSPGVDVVVPLVTSSGTALLVDRGWFATANEGSIDASTVPKPPSGTVTVTGWVRQNAHGGAAQVVDASTRAISSSQIEPAIGIPVYGGFVELLTESPRATTPADESRPTRPQQRPPLLLRAPVVVLRHPGSVRLRLPRLGGGHRPG